MIGSFRVRPLAALQSSPIPNAGCGYRDWSKAALMDSDLSILNDPASAVPNGWVSTTLDKYSIAYILGNTVGINNGP